MDAAALSAQGHRFISSFNLRGVYFRFHDGPHCWTLKRLRSGISVRAFALDDVSGRSDVIKLLVKSANDPPHTHLLNFSHQF